LDGLLANGFRVDLNFSPPTIELVKRTHAFVRDVVLDIENAFAGIAQDDVWRRSLQDKARKADVFAPHAPVEFGGRGLGLVERAPVFEEVGYSLFGALAINGAAPDEGNQHLLGHIADGEQRNRYLSPLARGEIRSAFAMTEPAPGAGSDPRALISRARRVPGGWRIDGRKHFITGADGAAFAIVMVRTSGVAGDAGGATMFLVDADNPGMLLERHIPTMDKSMIWGALRNLLQRVFCARFSGSR
jgi:alkylation response protein AidB-like acyl-CoA dehydrogenase